jgi:YD repeat-containing protein
MDEPMTKTLLALLTLALTACTASAQSRTYYDASGKVVGRSATDSQGTVTNYDSHGRVISRESTSGGTVTVYDAGGRSVGRVTTSPQRERDNCPVIRQAALSPPPALPCGDRLAMRSTAWPPCPNALRPRCASDRADEVYSGAHVARKDESRLSQLLGQVRQLLL